MIRGQPIKKVVNNHNLFTWSKQNGIERTTISKAKGIYFWDINNKKYLDFSSQLVNVNLGHSHPRLKKAIIKQINNLDYITPSFISKPKIELSRQISKLTGTAKVLFTTGGGEANENAIIIARQFSGKDIILSRSISYHGATYGARTASRDVTRNFPNRFNAPFFQYFSTPVCNNPSDGNHKSCCQKSLKELENLVKKFNEKIAAVILEPIPGAMGVLIPSKEYLPSLVKICMQNDILVIFDEVMTGFGRTGRWFSYQHWNLNPDIVTLSKGINGGIVPLGAVAVSKKIAKYFDEEKLLAGLTNSGHPVSCASGVEAINIYTDEKLIQKSYKLGKILKKLCQKIKLKYNLVTNVRSIGLFCSIEFEGSEKNSDSALFTKKVVEEAFKLGLYLCQRLNCILLAPPLVITEKELVTGVNMLDRAIENVISKN